MSECERPRDAEVSRGRLAAPQPLSPSDPHQIRFERKAHVLRAVRQAELLLDALLVRVYRLGRDPELAADLGAVEAARRQDHHRPLPIAQALEPRLRVGPCRRGRFDGVGERARDGWADVHVAGRDDADRLGELAIGRILGQVAACARGYLSKSAAERELAEAIRVVASGDVYVRPAVARALADLRDAPPRTRTDARARLERLSEREQTVVILTARGFNGPEIGRQLGITAKTVDTYKQRIEEKLGLAHRSEYVRFALEAGVLDELA